MASPPIPPPGSLQFKLVRTFVDLNVRVYETYDEYAVYRQRTRRETPVVILSPAG